MKIHSIHCSMKIFAIGKWLFNAGLRMDWFYFNYEDKLNHADAVQE